MNTLIRKADISDARSLLLLNEQFNGKQNITVEMIEESLESNNGEIVFVAIVDNIAIGFCCIRKYNSFCYDVDYAEITELYVNDAYQHQGIGSKLLSFAEDYLKSQNIENIQLFTEGQNRKAQAFYEKNGYSKSAEIMYRKRKGSYEQH